MQFSIDTGSELVIAGGMLSNAKIEIKPGASLHIINGGVIETREEFEVPVGAVIDVENGQII